MSRRLSSLAVAALLLAGGCLTVHNTKVFNGVRVDGGRTPQATVEIENSGWFLFTCIPILSGNPDRPNAASSRWFSNTVKLETNLRVLERELAREHVDEVANLTSHYEDEKYLICLVSRRAYHTSAVLLKSDKPNAPAKADPKSAPQATRNPAPKTEAKPAPQATRNPAPKTEAKTSK